MTIEEAHETILRSAADIANKRLPDEYQGWGPIFAPLPSKNTLSLTIQNGMNYIMAQPDRNERVKQLRKLAATAIRQALIENGDLFAGLILGYARKGEDYFDIFAEPEYEQMEFDF